MEKRYTALRIIGTSYKVLGVIVAILTVITALSVCGAVANLGQEFDRWSRQYGQDFGGLGALGGLLGGTLAAFLPIIMGISLAMLFYATGEAIYLGMDIEENTRMTVRFLQQQPRPNVPVSPPVIPPHLAPAIQEIAPIPEISQKNFCPQCGTKVDASDKKCPQCNYDLSE